MKLKVRRGVGVRLVVKRGMGVRLVVRRGLGVRLVVRRGVGFIGFCRKVFVQAISHSTFHGRGPQRHTIIMENLHCLLFYQYFSDAHLL